MKKVKVKNLKGNEIVALPIVTDSGTVLIHADVELKARAYKQSDSFRDKDSFYKGLSRRGNQ